MLKRQAQPGVPLCILDLMITDWFCIILCLVWEPITPGTLVRQTNSSNPAQLVGPQHL